MKENDRAALDRIYSSPLALCKCIYATLCLAFLPLCFWLDLPVDEGWVLMIIDIFAFVPWHLVPFILILFGGWMAYFARGRGKLFASALAVDIFGRIAGCLMLGCIVCFAVCGCFSGLFFLFIPLSVLGVSTVLYNVSVCVLQYRLRSLACGWEEINYSRRWLITARICIVISAVIYMGISYLFREGSTIPVALATSIMILQFCGIEPFTPFLLGRYRNGE